MEDDGFVTIYQYPRPQVQLELFPVSPLSQKQELDFLSWIAVADLPMTQAMYDRLRHLQAKLVG